MAIDMPNNRQLFCGKCWYYERDAGQPPSIYDTKCTFEIRALARSLEELITNLITQIMQLLSLEM